MSTVWQPAKPWAVVSWPLCTARRNARKAKHRPLHPLGLALFLFCVAILCFTLMAQKCAVWAVEIDGRRIAVAADAGVWQAALAEVERAYGGEGRWRDRVRVVRCWGGGPALPAEKLADTLASALGLRVTGTALKVDGQVQLVFKNRALAEMFLNYLMKSYRSGEQPRFLERVELAEVTVPAGRITDIQTALARAAGKTQATETYTVRAGDTSWDIAAAFGITPDALAAANPGIDLERLQIGQKLNISREKPLLTLVTTERLTRTETIPAPVQVRRDPSLYIGQQKVLQPGRPGQKEVTYLVTRHNGVEVARRVLESRVLVEPAPRVVARGSRLLLASRGGGQLAWPARGYISSRFGSRSGGFHTGIDIAGAYGSPIGAAEAGRVVYAGWSGGYGRMVEISHGGGVTTVYAHLSSIAVGVGDEVGRGQVVGYMGRSGNATGTHLHFEVRVNGYPRDPLRYL